MMTSCAPITSCSGVSGGGEVDTSREEELEENRAEDVYHHQPRNETAWITLLTQNVATTRFTGLMFRANRHARETLPGAIHSTVSGGSACL